VIPPATRAPAPISVSAARRVGTRPLFLNPAISRSISVPSPSIRFEAGNCYSSY